jgi:erythromycin esterase-like protein
MTDRLKDYLVPLRTLDPADADTADFAPVAAAIGDARIACIGEDLHCDREFYLLKDRLFRYLVTEHGFTAFVLESGFPEGLRVNDWVLGGAGDLQELSRNAVTYGLGDCDELRAQLRWMRDWNAGHDRKVRFYGLDYGGSGAMPRASVQACLARLPAAAGDRELLAGMEMGNRFQATETWRMMSEATLLEQVRALESLIGRAEAAGDEIAAHCARSALVIARTAGASTFGTGVNLRDEYMADTVRWILQREERILVAAHNGHIQRAPLFGNPMLGTFLAETHKAVVIGATCGSGRCVDIVMEAAESGAPRWTDFVEVEVQPAEGSLDAVLHAASPPLGFIDLRRLPADELQGVMPMMVQNHPFPVAVREAFDAIVHIGRVSVAEGMIQPYRDAIRLAQASRAGKGEPVTFGELG